MHFIPKRAWLARYIFVFLLTSQLLVAIVDAQVGLTQGSITGTVTDTSGTAISGASISVSSPNNASHRNTVSGPDGTFTIGNLDSGSYTVEIHVAGFAPYRNQSVATAVGRVTRFTVRLAPEHAMQQVTVQAQTEALDTSQSSPVTNIDRDRIEELPIPSRNYLTFTLLSPALATANPAPSRQTPGTSEGGFSTGGLRATSNALYIDGVDDDDEYTGLSRTELSPEAISDFQIVNHGYAAESGGAAGGSVDVETRSGATLQHGDAFLFVQNGALNGTPALEVVPRKPDENRLRAGLSTGGVFKPANLYYYAATEQEMARGEEATDFSPQMAAQIDRAVAQAGPLQGFRLQQGFFPTVNEETEASGRLDRSFGNQALMLRYALANNRSVNDAFHTDDLSDLSSRGSAFYNDNSISGLWSDTLSPQMLNRIGFEAAQRRATLRTGSTTGPGIVVVGVANFGTPFTGNSRRYETHLDFDDGLILQRGKHLLGTGVAVEHIALRSANQDGFGGLYVFPSLSALANGQAGFYTQSFGDPDTNFGEWRSSAYGQDHWTPLRSLSLDYGLRYENNHLPSPLPQRQFNLSPRFGLAWSPDRNWVARGGFGIFYDRFLLSTVNRIEQFNGSRAEQQIAEDSAAASLYQSGATFQAPLSGIAPSIWQAQPEMKNPYAETASLGVEHALPSQWTVSAEYRFVDGVHMGRTINANLPPPMPLTLANASSLGVAAPTAQQLGRLVFPQMHLDQAYDAINQFQTEANSHYNGLSFAVNRQFTEEFELMAGYTFSKTIDDASYDTEQPQNPYALSEERALSVDDQRHHVVLSGLWVLGPDLDDPQDRAKASVPNPIQRAIYGLEFAPILSATTGFPDNPLTGDDSNREHTYPFAARPLDLARNDLEGVPHINVDLRVLKMVPIWRGHLDIVAESFNIVNHQNTDLINPVFGSSQTASSTLADPIQIADPRRIQFSLDFEY
jgi:hypothetical protein